MEGSHRSGGRWVGQGFIQAYVVDKRLGPEDLLAERIDVGLGSFLTNLIAAFIVIACAATLWAHGETGITDAGTAPHGRPAFRLTVGSSARVGGSPTRSSTCAIVEERRAHLEFGECSRLR